VRLPLNNTSFESDIPLITIIQIHYQEYGAVKTLLSWNLHFYTLTQKRKKKNASIIRGTCQSSLTGLVLEDKSQKLTYHNADLKHPEG
jgi:hypothetical protein